jgi:hypothetical protein
MPRSLNKVNEAARINFIIKNINDRTVFGDKLRTSYTEKFEKEILEAVNHGGDLKSHYDFIIKHTDGTEIKCEEKGSENKKLMNKSPWENSVQVFNGSGKKFSVARKWAEEWYNKVTTLPEIIETYSTGPPPSIEEWLKKDAFVCGDPKTEYSKKLKKEYRALYPKCSMNGFGKSPYDYRKLVNPSFSFDQTDKETLIKETQEILDAIFPEKGCWLQTSGNDETMKFKWWGEIDAPKIKGVKMKYSTDLDFIYECDTLTLQAKLRFGKGCGFSNVRLDIK